MEDKLVNKIFKGLIRFLIEVIVMTVLIVGINNSDYLQKARKYGHFTGYKN